MMESLIDRLQLVGIAGTNKVMAGELSRLCRRALSDFRSPRPEKLGTGAVAFPFDPRVAMVAMRFHRTASRVLWDLYRSDANRLESLYDDIRSAAARDSRAWGKAGARFSIRPRNLKSFPAGVRQVVGTVKNALIDGAGERGLELAVDPAQPDFEVALRRHDDVITVSIDLGGGAQHLRGYRTEAGEAPLRENLAAVLLMLARYDARRDVLVDPMAGSGTIAIEAALMARGAPLRSSDSPLAAWPVFDGAQVQHHALFADADPRVYATEIDGRVAGIARANAGRAGIATGLEVAAADFRDSPPPALQGDSTGLIVTNPPYGRRLQEEDLGTLYRDFASWCRRAKGYRVALLIEDPMFEKVFGRRARIKKPLANASARTYFYLFDPPG